MDFPLLVASFPGAIFSHACWQSGDEAAAIFAAAAAVQLLGCEPTQRSDVKRTPDELALVKLAGWSSQPGPTLAGGRPDPAASTKLELWYSGRIGQLVGRIERR